MGLIETLRFVIENDFERITYTEAIDILSKCGEKFEFLPEWGGELQSEHERFLSEKHFKRPVVVTDYPKDCKAFYMKLNDDNKTVRAMDVLVPGKKDEKANFSTLSVSGNVLNAYNALVLADKMVNKK